MRWVVAAVMMFGCGAAAPPPPPANTPPRSLPDTDDALLDHLRADRDDMCACTERRCERRVEHAIRLWHALYQTMLVDQPLAQPTTPPLRALEDQIATCSARAKAAGPVEVSRADELRRLVTEACACVEQVGSASEACIMRVANETAKWASDNADGDEPDKPDTDEARLAAQLTACVQQAYAPAGSSSSPPPP